MNRNANDGMKYQANIDTVPLFSAEDPDAAILPLAAEAAGVRPEDVLGQDLFLYCRGCGDGAGRPRRVHPLPQAGRPGLRLGLHRGLPLRR